MARRLVRVLLPIVALTFTVACGDDDDATFECGTTRCETGSEFCLQILGREDDATGSLTCQPLPEGCADCACESDLCPESSSEICLAVDGNPVAQCSDDGWPGL